MPIHPRGILGGIIVLSLIASAISLAYLVSIMSSDENDYLLPQPNLVLFSVDSLRADHLKIYGYPRETAPNLTHLSKDAFVFEQAFTVSTHSAPAHSSLLTGLYPLQHGQVQNGLKLPDAVETLAEHLSRQGYATGGFVSDIILGEESNLQQGFDSFGVDHIHSGSPIHITQEWASRVWTRAKNWLFSWQESLQESQAQGKDYRRQPFFLWLHANHPHGNYNPPPGYRNLFMSAPGKNLQTQLENSQYDLDKIIRHALRNNRVDQELIDWVNNLYDGEIRFADFLLGELIQFLKQNGEYDRTVIIFVSDHGEMLFEQAKPGQERSAAHHAGLYYETVLKIPLVIKPSVHFSLPTTQRVKGNAVSLDIFPTAFALLGLNPPERPHALNLVPLMQAPGTAAGHTQTYFGEILFNNRCSGLKENEWRLIRCESPGKSTKSKLYNLAIDPKQQQNLYNKDPAKANQLEQLLDTWLDEQKGYVLSNPQNISDAMRRILKAGGYWKRNDDQNHSKSNKES